MAGRGDLVSRDRGRIGNGNRNRVWHATFCGQHLGKAIYVLDDVRRSVDVVGG